MRRFALIWNVSGCAFCALAAAMSAAQGSVFGGLVCMACSTLCGMLALRIHRDGAAS